jgi:regulatory protein YycH of two-component signal transduction system YycFG
MIYGQKITIIIISIIKHHKSKHYIYSILKKTYDNRLCLLKKYRFIISRMLTNHFRSELFDDSGIIDSLIVVI